MITAATNCQMTSASRIATTPSHQSLPFFRICAAHVNPVLS